MQGLHDKYVAMILCGQVRFSVIFTVYKERFFHSKLGKVLFLHEKNFKYRTVSLYFCYLYVLLSGRINDFIRDGLSLF